MIRHYHLFTKAGQYFSVNFQDLGGEPLSRDRNELAKNDEILISRATRERGERVVQVHRLAKNIVEMEVWQPVKNTNQWNNRIDHSVVHHGRMYTLGCGSLLEDREADKPTCQRFFKSIRFTK